MSGRRVKRLYRVTAVWASTTTRRDYQSKAAAEHHVEVLRTVQISDAALSITIVASDPITWPAP